MPKINITNRKQTIEYRHGFSLLNTFLMQDIPIKTVCGGKARCGACRILVLQGNEKITPLREAEAKRLGPELLAAGWRLACQNHILGDITVEIPEPDELLVLPPI